MFEGEEESGSPSIEAFVEANKERLGADLLLNCDGEFAPEEPRLNYAGRGIISAEVRVSGPTADIHSGSYGGLVQNPLHVAGKIIGSFHDDDGRVQLPGYYDSVKQVSAAEKERIAAGFQTESLLEGAGVSAFWGESIAPASERATVYPTLDVNGMWGGYQGAGNKTIIPAEAGFKVTMRISPDQDPRVESQLLKRHVENFATETVAVECSIGEEAWYFQLETEGPWLEAVQSAIETTAGVRAQLVRTGGSIPILGVFNRLIGLPITACLSRHLARRRCACITIWGRLRFSQAQRYVQITEGATPREIALELSESLRLPRAQSFQQKYKSRCCRHALSHYRPATWLGKAVRYVCVNFRCCQRNSSR